MSYPKITRTAATALLTSRLTDAVLVVHDTGRVEITTPQGFVAGGDGRMLLSRNGLEEDGVFLAAGTGRLAPGCGPILDRILHELNTYLAPTPPRSTMAIDTGRARHLGNVIRARRRALKLTQAEVAEAGGPSAALLRALENGRATTLSRRVAKDLERILGWLEGSIDVVLADGGEPVLVSEFETPSMVAERRHREILARLDRIVMVLERAVVDG